jgi:hypothetical protein
MATRRCSTCHRTLAKDNFARTKSGVRRKTCPRCLEKQAAKQRAMAARDPEAYKAASRRRAKESKARRRQPKVLLDIPDSGSDFWARLLCADALDVLDSTERPDLIVTDPPYGISLRHKKHG